MARELGMNPKSLRKLHNNGQQRWKAPLHIFIEDLYLKRLGKFRPDEIRTVEQIAAAQQAKKRAKKLAREQRRESSGVATANVIDFEDVFIEVEGDRDTPF
jgi:hypothetical protein